MGVDPRFYRRLGPIAAGDLAARLGAQLIGASAVAADDLAAPHAAGAGALFFLTDPRDRPAPGGLVIVPDPETGARFAGEGGAALVHPNPKAAFAQAAPLLIAPRLHEGGALIHPSVQIAEAAFIGPGCVIGQGAVIGAGVQIGPGAVIGPGVRIGAQTRIGARAVVGFADIGATCDISAGAVIGESGFGLADEGGELFTLPHVGRVRIEDEVTLGANVTVDRGLFDDTILGRGCRIDNLCHIAHNVVVGERAVMAAFAGVSGSARIGAGAQFGGRVGVADHLTIGAGARLGADAAVMTDVPDGETWAGSPAQPIRRFMRETAWLRRAAAQRPAKAAKAGKGGA